MLGPEAGLPSLQNARARVFLQLRGHAIIGSLRFAALREVPIGDGVVHDALARRHVPSPTRKVLTRGFIARRQRR
jgi:hypothetical protein